MIGSLNSLTYIHTCIYNPSLDSELEVIFEYEIQIAHRTTVYLHSNTFYSDSIIQPLNLLDRTLFRVQFFTSTLYRNLYLLLPPLGVWFPAS